MRRVEQFLAFGFLVGLASRAGKRSYDGFRPVKVSRGERRSFFLFSTSIQHLEVGPFRLLPG